MFDEITMINYSRSLPERAAARKRVGPYKWRPPVKLEGRGFYMASKPRGGLVMDEHGSTFRLRLELANDHLPAGSRLRQITGYFCDRYGDEKLEPIIARLPSGRGFLAGWSMGAVMCGSMDRTVYAEPEEAARAAHDMAEADGEVSMSQDLQDAEEAEETDT